MEDLIYNALRNFSNVSDEEIEDVSIYNIENIIILRNIKFKLYDYTKFTKEIKKILKNYLLDISYIEITYDTYNIDEIIRIPDPNLINVSSIIYYDINITYYSLNNYLDRLPDDLLVIVFKYIDTPQDFKNLKDSDMNILGRLINNNLIKRLINMKLPDIKIYKTKYTDYNYNKLYENLLSLTNDEKDYLINILNTKNTVDYVRFNFMKESISYLVEFLVKEKYISNRHGYRLIYNKLSHGKSAMKLLNIDVIHELLWDPDFLLKLMEYGQMDWRVLKEILDIDFIIPYNKYAIKQALKNNDLKLIYMLMTHPKTLEYLNI